MIELKTKADRVQWVMDELESLYPETPVPLDHTDAYTLLVAVLLSAQCTDARVNTVTPALFELADNPRDMMRQSVEDIRQIIRPCGLSPRKSAAISELSRILVEQHGGDVPQDFDALEALPGVGHKTAAVVMSQAFGVPAFPVDTHIHRLMHRWNFTNGKSVEQTERDAKRLFPEDAGTSSTSKSSSTAANTARHGDGRWKRITSPPALDGRAFGKRLRITRASNA